MASLFLGAEELFFALFFLLDLGEGFENVVKVLFV